MSGIVRFGVFEVDLRSGELRRSGVRVPLQDQPFRVLAYLIERAGEVVTREELREHLWPEEFVDFDHGLNTAIRKLRAALDDSAENPRFIETLARRGYRFIAPVSADPARRPRTAIGIALGIALALMIAGAVIFQRTSEARPQIWAVAVLPFTHDGDPQVEPLGDGLTEVLIDTLSRLADVRVMATSTVFQYKGEKIDPRTIGAELDVGAVVVGDIRRRNDRYEIRVELIDVRDGSQLWGDRLDIPAGELAMAQSRISDALLHRLRHGRRGPGAYTRSAEAYELYLRGLHAWNQRGKDDVRESVELFRLAAERDPGFAAAYAGLANAWGVMVGNGLISAKEGAPKVLAAARKALELDPMSAEAYTSIATTKFRNVWDFEGAEEDYRRALSLNPNYATGHQWYSDYLRAMGRFEEARREIEIAYKLDPLSRPIHGAMCFSFFFERRYQEAIEFTTRAGEIDPRYRSTQCMANSYAALGNYDKAVEILSESPNDDGRAIIAAFRRGGRKAMLEERAERLLAWDNRQYRVPVEIAESYALLGNHDEAMRWLEIAWDNRVSRLTSVHLHPAFDRMRDDPRYIDLMQRIGLPKVY